MTEGEKMVWAAALVREWDRRVKEASTRRVPSTEDRITEMTRAAEHAFYVVEYLREALPRLPEDTSIARAAREMLS